jgi:predicted DNA-binding antitoxin AbrB/MazE fold protein
MNEILTAIYENGILRPLRPLNLQEQQRVRVQVWPEEPADEVEDVIRKLAEAGIITPPVGYSELDPLSEEERLELARVMGQATGKPLSEIIVEERGE